MEKFLDSNPGLRSRFNKYIRFQDYSAEELRDIFIGLCKQNEVTIEDDCLNHVYSFFTHRLNEKRDNFANGRDVRNFFEKAMIKQADRLAVLDHISDEDIRKLLLEDVIDISID